MLKHMPTKHLLSFLLFILFAVTAHAADVEYVNNGRGNVPVYLPSDYDDTKPLPLIISLHGYSDPNVDGYFEFVQQVDTRQFIYCVPRGTNDFTGAAFWAGTDACCNFFGSNVDDSGYLRQLIELIQAQYAVDASSIHFTGISNGGFMSYRMACDHADLIASIVPIAGTSYLDVEDCTPSEPVHVLHIHGTQDSTIRYDGGCIVFSCYPGAEESVSNWTGYNGCDFIPQDGGPAFNLDWSVGGNETTSTIYEQNCEEGVTVELWEMAGSEHVPNFRRNSDAPSENLFANLAIDWMLAHPKPRLVQCSSDVDGNKVVDVNDLLSLLGSWGSDKPESDIDDNGIVNTVDLLTLIDNWGPCP
tara:strand:+ start:364 stop:1440 length:1077 start_codon:yes stop_codon:yes gene_type:complete